MIDADEIAKKIITALEEKDTKKIVSGYQELTEYLTQAVRERDLILSDPKMMILYVGCDVLLEAIGAELVGEWFMGLGSQ